MKDPGDNRADFIIGEKPCDCATNVNKADEDCSFQNSDTSTRALLLVLLGARCRAAKSNRPAFDLFNCAPSARRARRSR